jgi:hypothetical protein
MAGQMEHGEDTVAGVDDIALVECPRQRRERQPVIFALHPSHGFEETGYFSARNASAYVALSSIVAKAATSMRGPAQSSDSCSEPT